MAIINIKTVIKFIDFYASLYLHGNLTDMAWLNFIRRQLSKHTTFCNEGAVI